MMKQLLALLNVFRKGEEVANPALWKNGQVVVNLGALIVAIAALLGSFGVIVEITDAQSLSIAGGVVAAYNVVLTVITSRRIGLLPAKPASDGGADPVVP